MSLVDHFFKPRYLNIEETLLTEEIISSKDNKSSDDLGRRIYEHLINIVDIASTIISFEVKAPCAVCLKLLMLPNNHYSSIPVVRILLRDTKSYEERILYNLPDDFPYTDNSAFKAILDNNLNHFSSDNLIELAVGGGYNNSNEYWRKLYNSTLVLPIRKTRKDIAIGFMCVDSWYGKLSRVSLKKVLQISEHVYTGLQLICAIEARQKILPGNVINLDDYAVKWNKKDNIFVPNSTDLQKLLEIGTKKLHDERLKKRAMWESMCKSGADITSCPDLRLGNTFYNKIPVKINWGEVINQIKEDGNKMLKEEFLDGFARANPDDDEIQKVYRNYKARC